MERSYPFTNRSKLWPYRHLIGRVEDEKIAKMAGCAPSSVERHRRAMGLDEGAEQLPPEADEVIEEREDLEEAQEALVEAVLEDKPVMVAEPGDVGVTPDGDEVEIPEDVFGNEKPAPIPQRIELLRSIGRTARGHAFVASVYEGPMVPLVLAAVEASGLPAAKVLRVLE